MGLAVKKVSSRRRAPLRGANARKGIKPALSKEYQAVFENTGKAMVIVEEDATISLANEEFEQLSGYTKEEIEDKKSWTEFVARDDRKRVREYHRLRKTDPMLAPRSFEFRFLDRQEKVKNVVLTIGTIPGTNKSMASLLDITDRRQTEMSQRNSKGQEGEVKEQMVELKKANEALQAEVADLKRKVKKLEKSEDRYRSLVENVDFGINLIDAEHNIVMANTEQGKRLHKPVSELIGKKCFREFEKRDAVCPNCPGVQTLATGQSAEAEIEGIRDGSRFNARLQTFPIFGDDGTVISFIEVGEDITERVRSEEAFRASEERFRMLAENMPFGISVMAPDKRFEYFNPQFTAIFGYTIEDIPDKDTWFEKAYPDEVYRKEVSSLWKKDVKQDVKIGEENPRVFSVQCKDGEDKIIDFRTVYLGDGKQYLFYEDITDRSKAEEALKQSEERYRALVENVNLGINLIDADHNIVMVNAGQSSHFGKPRSETIGKKCYQEFEKRDTVCPHCPGVQTMATGKPSEAEAEATRDDGSHFNVRLQTFPIVGQDGAVTAFIEVVEDITERKQMEEQLQQTEERYRTLVETMKVGLTAVDQKGVLTYANEQHCKMLGYSMDEMIGRPTTDFQDEETQKAQKEIFAKRKKGMRDPSPYEITWVTKDGRKVHTILTPTPSYDEDGHYTGSFAIFTDITERKQMEEQLQKSEALYRTLIETTKVGVSAINENGVIIYANDRHCEIWGYTLNEIMGRRVSEFVDEKNLKILQEQLAKRREGGRNSYEIAWRRKDGQNVSTILAPTPIFDAYGHFKGSYGFITDITERKRMEEELQQAEEQYRTLVETMRAGLTSIDEKGVITYANEQFCTKLGYSMDEVIGRPTVDFYYDEETRKFQEEVFAKRRKGMRDPTPYEIAWKTKDGQKVYTILAPTPRFDADGRYIGSSAISTDITERKRMEERLQRYTAELERSNEEVKNFAYIVSHDLRVPLVNLKGYTAELRSALEVIAPNMDTILSNLTEEKRSAVAMALHEDVPEALEFITTSVSQMDSFINAVLHLSRLGRRELKSEPIDMNALVQTRLETLSHQIQERGIKVTVGSLPQVVADRTAMEQIMGNVLGNAVKYLDPDRPGQIKVSAETNNGEQIFRIQDNGRGIAQDDMHKVFAPFRRAGKQDTQGEGMGLAYVQTLVRRHGGRIWCESELEKGTTMTFTISQHLKEAGGHVKD